MTPQDASRRMRDLCSLAPVVPVLVVQDPAHAAPLARALVAGGLPMLEVTLRTPSALAVIAEMKDVPGAIVGAGTLITAGDAEAAQNAGAVFGVSPGATDGLLDGCERIGLPLLPGAATASEAMRLLARGYDMMKFFPAEAAGGVDALKALAGPLPQITFCPTGGVNPANLKDYLALPNVTCAGGSWVAPHDMVAAEQWGDITSLCRAVHHALTT